MIKYLLTLKLEEHKEMVQLEKYKLKWKTGMPSDWAKLDVDKAINKKYVPEYLQSDYQNPISKEEFAELFFTSFAKELDEVYRIEDYTTDVKEITPDFLLSKVTTTQKFADTDNKYIKLAYIFGMFDPDENDKFYPKNLISREYISKILMKFFQTYFKDDQQSQMIEDINEISESGINDVNIAFNNRLFDTAFLHNNDQESFLFNPQQSVTREEAITIINALENDVKRNFCLPLRGYLLVDLIDYMSGFEIDGNIIKMKSSEYDCKRVIAYFCNEYTYFRENSYILNYDSEKISSFFLFPRIDVRNMVDNKYLSQVVKGQYTCKDYNAFTVEHNKDGYLAVITKKPGFGRRFGKDMIFNDKNQIVELIKQEKCEHTIVSKPALNEKEKQTYLGRKGSVYPQTWEIPVVESGMDYTDSIKPIGTKVGYALETDVAVTINGKNVKSYNIGGKIAIELDALKEFGYDYEFIDKSYDYNGKKVVSGQINLYRPKEDKIKKFNEKPIKKSSDKNGKVVYELVGDQYEIVEYNKDKKAADAALRGFVSTTGKRFILVDELWNDNHFYIDKLGVPQDKNYLASYYKVEGNPHDPVYLFNNDLAIVNKNNPKHFKVDMLTKENCDELFRGYNFPIKYPQLLDKILDPYALQAWYVAEDIVNNSVKPNMSDKEKSDAISKALINHGYYLNRPLINNGRGYYNWDDAYDALVQKYANLGGWLDAFEMCYSIAGLDVYPESGTEAYEYSKSSKLLPVKLDGEWHFINCIPKEYLKAE